jgi:hypothetical protein
MPRVIIQPASNKDSRKHFVDTVENPVDLSLHKVSAGSDLARLMELSENGKVAMWGVTPGKNGANLSKFKKIEVGDFVFFTRDNKVYSTGEITHIFNNPKLATDIWTTDANGQTWENMYTLKNVQEQNIPYPILRNAIGSDSGDNFMGFRPLDQGKSVSALSLIGIQTVNWNIKVGEVLKRTEIHSRYGGGGMGGIEPSARTPNIFIFTSDSGTTFGYNFDEELEDGSFLYTGDGQIGDQDPTVGGNKAIIEHRKKGRALRLFESAEKKTFVRYVGEFELADAEPETRRAPDAKGDERDVLVFHLIPVGLTKKLTKRAKEVQPASVTWQDPERNTGDSHTRQISASTTIATRQEAQLQNRYIEFLRNKGHEVGTYTISIPESNAPLRVDLVDRTTQRLVEVKAGSSRGYVREAIGQVLDYVFQMKRIGDEVWSPAILLPGRPSDDLVTLITNLGIELVWESENSFLNSADGKND